MFLQILDCHVRVLDGVVQGGGGQKFGIVGHRGDDGHRFQDVDHVREPFASAFRAGVGLHGKADGFVDEGGI